MVGYGTSPYEMLASDAMLKGLAYLEDFTYSVAFENAATVIAPQVITEYTILIASDSDFIGQEYNLAVQTGGLGTPTTLLANPDWNIQLAKSGSGHELATKFQDVSNYAGNYHSRSTYKSAGRRTFSDLFQANMIVTVRLLNRFGSTAAADRVDRFDFAMIGFKVFYQINPQTGEKYTTQDIFPTML